MNIKDIVNRDIVNLQNCDQEPIHIPGTIQPHGMLIALESDTFTIRFCSGNSDAFTGIPCHNLLGKNISHVFGDDFPERIKAGIMLPHAHNGTFILPFAGKSLEFSVHSLHPYIIIEAEYANPNDLQTHNLFDISRQFMGYMEEAPTLTELCSLVAAGVRDVTGYDRVMIYRFDKEYNGIVIAEDKREELEPFLGLHYPHTDIPVQARELYIRNLIRVIADVEYTPVPIYTEDDGTEKNLDLSMAILRSVSPIHIQYLHNMGVSATLTISLLHKGKLWGLIACHHYTPKPLSHAMRMAARLQGHFITSQIDVRQANEEYESSRKVNLAVDTLLSKSLALNRRSLETLVEDTGLQALCNADGVAVSIDQKIYKRGFVPADDDIRHLANHLIEQGSGKWFYSESLIKDVQTVGTVAEVFPGILFFPLDTAGNHISWYRGETIRHVNWAGDPNKAIEKDTRGLSPRKSFELWKETVKYKSREWMQPEINAASNFVNVLQKHLAGIYLAEEEEKQRVLAQSLAEMNAELENINWISTHDLQEPLRKIQFLTSFVLDDKADLIPTEVREKIERINLAAAKMQTLVRDILKYTKLNHVSDSFVKIDLNLVLKELQDELREAIDEKDATIIIDTLPVVKGVPFLVKQVFANLIYNALKFSAPGRKPHITISYTRDEPHGSQKEYYQIHVSDNGTGFDEKHKDIIFNIFARLHAASENTGSGIGLALCKKIMYTHKGMIKATGVAGEGAEFTLYFPIG